MVSTSGDILVKEDSVQIYKEDLFPFALIITPNSKEAERLLGWRANSIIDVIFGKV